MGRQVQGQPSRECQLASYLAWCQADREWHLEQQQRLAGLLGVLLRLVLQGPQRLASCLAWLRLGQCRQQRGVHRELLLRGGRGWCQSLGQLLTGRLVQPGCRQQGQQQGIQRGQRQADQQLAGQQLGQQLGQQGQL